MKREFKQITPEDHRRPVVSQALTPAEWKAIYNALLLDQISNDTEDETIKTILDKVDKIIDR